DADVLAPDLVLVMQRSVGYRDAADEYGLQARDRGQCAGASDLDTDVEDFGRHLLGGKLVRDGEPGRARDEAEADLLLEIVDLVHDAVDLERHLAAPLADAPVVIEHAIQTLHDRPFAGDGKAKSGQPLQQG